MAFVEKMKNFFDKSVEVSKSAFEKAGDAVQDFGDKSVTKIEIKKLETKLEKQYAEIGKFIFDLSKNNADFSDLNEKPEFSSLIESAESVKKEIEVKKMN